jgi:hypothetical protein
VKTPTYSNVRKILFGLGLATACACGTQTRLQVDGPTPYVRCLSGPTSDERTLRVGALTLAVKEQALTITGAPPKLRLAVFSGPGMGPALGAATVKELASSGAQLVLMLGGLGQSAERASENLKVLSALPQPLLFVAGGRDSWPALQEAFSSLRGDSRIIDATKLAEIRIADSTFLPISGAEGGRDAVSAEACGFGQRDLDARADALKPPRSGEKRWLLAWQAPGAGRGPGITRTRGGTDAGGFALARFAKRVGIAGGLHAWPALQAERPELGSDGSFARMVVARLWGSRLQRDDGTRPALGFSSFDLDREGLHRLP